MLKLAGPLNRRHVLTSVLTLLAGSVAVPAEAEDVEPAKKEMKPVSTIVSIEHVTIPSTKPFDVVRRKLESGLPHVDEGIVTLLRFAQTEKALSELENGPKLSIFGSRDHGMLLQIAGRPRHAVQYDIGNMLTASLMTRHVLSAGLYAPIRVLLREDGESGSAFEYDRPVSTFGQFADAEVTRVASELDTTLRAALEQAAA